MQTGNDRCGGEIPVSRIRVVRYDISKNNAKTTDIDV